MKGSSNAWITFAEDDESALKCLVLGRSLRWTMTSHKMFVLTFPQVSAEMQKKILAEWNGTIRITPIKGKSAALSAKINAFGLSMFNKIAFIYPDTLVLKNMDRVMFQSCDDSGKLGVDEQGNIIAAVFHPSEDGYQDLFEFPAVDKYFEPWMLRMGATYIEKKHIIEARLGVHVDIEKAGIAHFGKVHPLQNIREGEKFKDDINSVHNFWCKLYMEVTQENNLTNQIQPLRFESEPIAIIGMSCRFPECNNLQEYWDFLISGGQAVSSVPDHRWGPPHYNNVTKAQRETRAGFLKCPVDEFDSKFFGVSSVDLFYMDPQQRILLELVWEALEDAGLPPSRLKNTRTGVFTGSWAQDYRGLLIASGIAQREFIRTHLGGSFGGTAGKIGHYLGLSGSNVGTESACSSSSVAVGLAVASLRKIDSKIAIACGVNLLIEPFTHNDFKPLVCPDGKCKSFDSSADGYGRAEGCGVLILKRLSDAVADNDPIHALIRGYGEAQEAGAQNIGTPTVLGEKSAMLLAIKDAGINPAHVSHVEAHGTGTTVGDPLEFASLSKVYAKGRKTPLIVTSGKANIGHTESCSGMAGIIKTVLSMKHSIIPGHIGCAELNPSIKLHTIPAIIPMKHHVWNKIRGQPRLAGVSSFGFTGTDTHLILQEAPPSSPINKLKKSICKHLTKNIVTLSAKTEEALQGLISGLSSALEPEVSKSALSDIAFTRNTGRDHLFPWRAAIIASDITDLKSMLTTGSFTIGEIEKDQQKSKVAFVFSGQGSQYYKMGQKLYSNFPVFAKHFDFCIKSFQSYGIDILPVIWGENSNDPRLDEALFSQTGIFAVEFALFKLWESWGVKPDVVVGNSLGEFATAYAAGIWSAEDAVKIVAIRALLLEKVENGGMLVTNRDVKGTEELLEEFICVSKADELWLDIACINAHAQTVVSGESKTLELFKTFLEVKGAKGKILGTNKAYHSRHMDSMTAEYRSALQSLTYHPPRCHFVGGQTGKLVEGVAMGPEYWVKQLRESVHFMDASNILYEMGVTMCLDVSPHPIAASLVASNIAEVAGSAKIPCIPSLRKNCNDMDVILSALGEIYTNGVNINWRGFHKDFSGSIIPLPSYPFTRKKYWFTAPPSLGINECRNELHSLLGSPLRNASSSHIFQTSLNLSLDDGVDNKCAWMKDHVLGKHVIFPGAGYVELCLAGAYASTLATYEDFNVPEFPMRLSNLKILVPMDIDNNGGITTLQTIVVPREEGLGMDLSIYKHQGNMDENEPGKWVTHATSSVSFLSSVNQEDVLNVGEITQDWNLNEAPFDKFYKNLDKVGLHFGPTFRSLDRKWISPNDNDTVIQVAALPQDEMETGGQFFCHPILIDSMIQAIMYVNTNTDLEVKLRVPAFIESFSWYAKSESVPYYIHIRGSEKHLGIASLYDSVGRLIAKMDGAQTVETDIEKITKIVESQKISLPSIICENVWKPCPIPAENDNISSPIDEVKQIWLVFGKPSDFRESLQELMNKCNRGTYAIQYGSEYSELSWNSFNLRPDRPQDFREMIKKLKPFGNLEGIIYLGGGAEIKQEIETQGFLNLLKVVATTKWSSVHPKVVLVTEGIVPVGNDGDSVHPSPGTLWGVLRTYQSEFDKVNTLCIDLEPGSSFESKTNQVGSELWKNDDREYHVAYRSNIRHIPRATTIKLNQLSNPLSISKSERQRLILPTSKAVSDLKFGILPKLTLAANQVEVRVEAAGLNFKDVLSVLKPSEEFDNENCVGADFSGVISSIGGDVTKWKVGDSVLGCNFEQGALPSHMCMHQDRIVPLPSWMTYAEGATLSVVFSTAYHCLVTVGKLQAGETILIHAASGGVGLVAIQIAKELGANVIATAGNNRKRAYLRGRMGLEGKVSNSRSLDFEKAVMRMTNGNGIDMLLNSLTSPGYKEASLACLKNNGRFVEMSKLNIWSVHEVKKIRGDVNYTVVDLTQQSEETWIDLCRALNTWLQSKKIEPLPYTRFDSVCIRDALSYLQKAKHIGKVVCLWGKVMNGGWQKPPLFNERSTYLITGGLGGIGIELMKYMIENGAQHLVLFGRSQPTEKTQNVINALNADGSNVILIRGDVGKLDDCNNLMATLANNAQLPPVRGVMHAAGCLMDAIFLNQTWDKMEICFNAKVSGGWNLHLLTRSLNLEHFVTYSSIAAILGSMGQANHSAGNWYLDSLVNHRISNGLPATTINWGQWGQVGVAADMEIPGLKPFTPTQAFSAMELILKGHKPQALIAEGDVLHIKSIYNWTQNYLSEIKVQTSTQPSLSRSKVTITTDEFWKSFESSDANAKPEVVESLLTQAYSHVLKLGGGEKIKADQILRDVGVDSMMTFEVKNMIQEVFGNKVSFTVGEISDCNTVSALTTRLMEIVGVALQSN